MYCARRVCDCSGTRTACFAASIPFCDVEIPADELVGWSIGVIIRVYHLKKKGMPVC